MKIRILHLKEGAKKATGITVIIDVFRAFTVEAYMINNGIKRLYPVGNKEIAYKYKENHPNAILIGERHGKILDGFDYGNSPSQIENIDFTGKIAVHTTSAGTQGIENAVCADEILTGSLVNAKAISRYLKANAKGDVSLVCMGLEGAADTDEDILCAAYIKSLLEDKPIDLTEKVEQLKHTSGAKFFDKGQQSVFPEKDFYLSTEIDKFDFILRLCKVENGLNYIEKIEMP